MIPWAGPLAPIEPHHPKAGNGTRPRPMELILRIYIVQNWFNLSDPHVESRRRFAGIEVLGHDIPHESRILRLRHLLEQHKWHRQTALAVGIRYRINRRTNQRSLSKYQQFINRLRGTLAKLTIVVWRRILTGCVPPFPLANPCLLRRRLLSRLCTCAQ